MTTETKRVPPGVAGGTTNRVTGAITQDITRRVTGAITSGGATQRISGAIVQDITKRVVGAITASITVRVPEEVIGLGPFLLLEGDFAGLLTMEGDDTDGYFGLQGSY